MSRSKQDKNILTFIYLIRGMQTPKDYLTREKWHCWLEFQISNGYNNRIGTFAEFLHEIVQIPSWIPPFTVCSIHNSAARSSVDIVASKFDSFAMNLNPSCNRSRPPMFHQCSEDVLLSGRFSQRMPALLLPSRHLAWLVFPYAHVYPFSSIESEVSQLRPDPCGGLPILQRLRGLPDFCHSLHPSNYNLNYKLRRLWPWVFPFLVVYLFAISCALLLTSEQ